MSERAISRRRQVLERAGLVTERRDGQHRPVHLERAALVPMATWIWTHRHLTGTG